MKNKLESIMKTLDDISYGFVVNGKVYTDDREDWKKLFSERFRLQKPEETMKNKYGVCWDLVELERYLFSLENIKCESYFMISYDDDNCPTHTFMVVYDDKEEKYYYFEYAFERFRGIFEYASLRELLLDVKSKFTIFLKEDGVATDYIFLYKYDKPASGLNCDQFYKHCENGTLIKLNKPLYFYHVINKDADMSMGILSLQYMYEHKLYDMFDKNAEKYFKRIVDDWNIPKYKGRTNLTREEIIDGLNIFRGENGAANIYFFRFAPYKGLGKKIEELLKYKDIYRININDEEVQLQILDIFYGYDMSNSDNKVLDKDYYENVTRSEYFKDYDDSLIMNFSRLNHIGIVFSDFYCPIKFLEKVEAE